MTVGTSIDISGMSYEIVKLFSGLADIEYQDGRRVEMKGGKDIGIFAARRYSEKGCARARDIRGRS